MTSRGMVLRTARPTKTHLRVRPHWAAHRYYAPRDRFSPSPSRCCARQPGALIIHSKHPKPYTVILIYVWESSDKERGGYVMAVKATKIGDELFLLSYRRLSRTQAQRDAEIGRLWKKAEKK